MWICAWSKGMWTKGAHSFQCSFLRGLSLPFTLLHPPLNTKCFPHFPPSILLSSLLLFTDYLDIYSLSLPFLPSFPFQFLPVSQSISVFLAAALRPHSHSIHLHLHTHFHYPLSSLLISIFLSILFHSSQSSTSSLTLIHTSQINRPGLEDSKWCFLSFYN